ncbi:glycosyltransferase family 2 protein [Flavobacteriales bacterium]|nr:glycosyltransferase family 2 protein [Flavobacteriales bacterium]
MNSTALSVGVLIPAMNEEASIKEMVLSLYDHLIDAGIKHYILVVNDHSGDSTEAVLKGLRLMVPTLSYVNNEYNPGFGNAVRFGLDKCQGDVLALMMADACDNPLDLVRCVHEIAERDVSCVFGSRFVTGGKVDNYPEFKLFVNRFGNQILRLLVDTRLNDFTNAFKVYRREVIESCSPYESTDFSLTLEIPLKALENGWSFSVVPISWKGRIHGYSKLNLVKNLPSYFKVLINHLKQR